MTLGVSRKESVMYSRQELNVHIKMLLLLESGERFFALLLRLPVVENIVFNAYRSMSPQWAENCKPDIRGSSSFSKKADIRRISTG